MWIDNSGKIYCQMFFKGWYMKLLRCKLCRGEVDIIGNEKSIKKKVKCQKCNFTNDSEQKDYPEVIVIRKRKISS